MKVSKIKISEAASEIAKEKQVPESRVDFEAAFFRAAKLEGYMPKMKPSRCVSFGLCKKCQEQMPLFIRDHQEHIGCYKCATV